MTSLISSHLSIGSPNPQKTISLKSFKSYFLNSSIIISLEGSSLNHKELFSLSSLVCLKQNVHAHVQRFVVFT